MVNDKIGTTMGFEKGLPIVVLTTFMIKGKMCTCFAIRDSGGEGRLIDVAGR